MELITAIHNRRSIRNFKTEPVPRKVLKELLDTCRWAPSGSNTQPWEFIVLGGTVLEKIKKQLIQKSEAEWDISLRKYKNIYPDIPYPEMPEPYRSRASQLTGSVDAQQFPPGTKNIDEKRIEYRLRNASFLGAPNGIIICTERELIPRALIGIGIMVQTIALAALNYGLGTCIMSHVVYWPDILRKALAISDSKVIVVGIGIGYPDPAGPLNSMPRAREPLSNFVQWKGFRGA